MRSNFVRFMSVFLAAAGLLGLRTREAGAVPGFSRQTGMACNVCHYVYPELRSFGRQFKLNGYTLTGIKTIGSTAPSGRTDLDLLNFLPSSVMLQASYTDLNEPLTGTGNSTVELPQQFSVFIAGQIAPHVGSFIQITYDDQAGSFGWDNLDLRYANQTQAGSKSLAYGVTLNNSPTVQDLWNSTPAWGFPFASSGVAPSPLGSALLDGGLAQSVAGLGGYMLYDNLVYGELDFYRSVQQGGHFPADINSSFTLDKLAPYWRLAVQHQWTRQYLEVGTYGLSGNFYPAGIVGPTDKYLDVAFDMQYEVETGCGNVLFHSTWIYERQDLDAAFPAGTSSNPRDKLRTFRLDGRYYNNSWWALYGGFFSTSATRDMLLYGSPSVNGSRSGNPSTRGFLAQLDLIPWQNLKLSAQYVFYSRFNGAGSDYDGFGREASDNNHLYLLSWISF